MEALLVDDADRILDTSPTVTFHMWQASALFPNARPRKPRPETPPPSPVTPPQQKPKPVTPPKR
jgi:hypothetical protein